MLSRACLWIMSTCFTVPGRAWLHTLLSSLFFVSSLCLSLSVYLPTYLSNNLSIYLFIYIYSAPHLLCVLCSLKVDKKGNLKCTKCLFPLCIIILYHGHGEISTLEGQASFLSVFMSIFFKCITISKQSVKLLLFYFVNDFRRHL